MKIKKMLVVQIVALILVLSPMVAKASVQTAVDYLKSQTQDAWTTQALVASGESSVITDHLKTAGGSLATDYAKTILALAAVDKNPATFGDEDYVAKLKSFYINNQMGDESLFNDDAWSILALSSIGQVGSLEVEAAKNFLLSKQNSDGGWGYATGVDSDTNDTAAIIMALVEAGVSSGDQVIVNAINYLQSAQNSDGGFSYDLVWSTDSDSNSDAWVISALYKVGQDPITWDKEGNNPITHLNSLQDTDGGFWWVKAGDNKAGTAWAVVALSGKSYPVDYYEPVLPVVVDLRIEGGLNTICNISASGITALDILTNNAETCGYTYNIQNTSFGPYLDKINDEMAAGVKGWMYLVNNISPEVGAGDYGLNVDDKVLWYYGEWGWMPTRLTVDQTSFAFGQTANITVEYFDGQNWLGLDSVTINAGSQTYTTDNTGKLIAVLPAGKFFVSAEKNNYIRSNQAEIEVSLATNQASTNTETVLNATQTEAVVTPNIATTISVPVDVVNATLNFQSLLNNNSAILPNITINSITSLSANPIQVIIPDNTTVTASATWNGIMQAPKILTSDSVSVVADEGKNSSTTAVVEVGSSDLKLSFDKAVRLLIPDSAGKDTGYTENDIFAKIISICSADTQEVGDALVENSECKIDVNSDLVIWTKHFTKFITYSQTAIPASGGGNGLFFLINNNQTPAEDIANKKIEDKKEAEIVENKLIEVEENELVETVENKSTEIEEVKVMGVEFEEKLTIQEQLSLEAKNISTSIVVGAQNLVPADFEKYIKLLNVDKENLTSEQIKTITDFVNFGTMSVQKLGAGERAGLLNSYKTIFGKLPTSAVEWEDVIKIGNGLTPSQETNNDKAKAEFVKIYKKEADLSNTQDKLVIDMITYGLKPQVRNLEKEKSALKIFQTVYGTNPNDARTWNILQAIAYAGE